MIELTIINWKPIGNGSSLALFVERVIDANVIIQKNEKEKMI